MTSIGEGAGTHSPLSVPQWVIDPDCTGLFMHLCILLLYALFLQLQQHSKIISEVNCRTSFVYLCFFYVYTIILVC